MIIAYSIEKLGSNKVFCALRLSGIKKVIHVLEGYNPAADKEKIQKLNFYRYLKKKKKKITYNQLTKVAAGVFFLENGTVTQADS